MNLAEIQADNDLRRREFPVTRTKLYLAHAAVCPLPARVAGSMKRHLQRASRAGQFAHLHRATETAARSLAAELLEVSPEEVAFVPSTSTGLSLVAAGLDWKPGDSVVVAQGDFPANLYPWLALERLGVRVKQIAVPMVEPITLDHIRQQLDARTRLVSLSSIHYVTGAPIDLDAIGAYLQRQSILFCVDAIQSLGAVPCSARHVDFLVADGHKWLLGPEGMGILIVRRQAMERLRPVLIGWKSVGTPGEYVDVCLSYADSARRYEPGSLNSVGLIGLRAALALLRSLGIANIANHLSRLRAALVEELLDLGYRIVGPQQTALPTGITSFQCPRGATATIYERLDRQGCVVSLRKDPRGEPCIRVSPHGYNTLDEIREFLKVLGPADGR
jgi:cysteine desulfurase / selenocysteine lyase